MFSTALTVSLWQMLGEWDRSLFVLLNRNIANPFFDAVLPYFRDSFFWTPFYLFIGVFILLNYGKKGAWWAVFFIATVAVADLTGTYIFKETVRRLRPCNDPNFTHQVRLVLQHCPGGYSFLSNHAANHFGLATFMILTFRHVLKHWIYLVYLWAFLISFAQVYVGVHYPSDIAGGAVLGMLAGYVTASVYHHNFGHLNVVN